MATVTSVGTVRARRTPIDWIAGALVIIGAINWGLVGLIHLDLVAAILGSNTVPARVVYVLVGLSGIYCLIRAFVPSRDTGLTKR